MKLLPLIVAAIMLNFCEYNLPEKYPSFEEYPVYDGFDLGLQYHTDDSKFKIWAPTAQKVRLHLYETALGGQAYRTLEMTPSEKGTWTSNIKENLKGKYYTFQVLHQNQWLDEVPDPYVYAVGTNGKRGHIIDLNETNPVDWKNDKSPALHGYEDIIIYELHVRDMSTHANSGIQQKGKFLGLTTLGTQSPDGEETGLDHLKSLGVTHVHLLPAYDFLSIDESKLEEQHFNWGYDPQNYNVPEGSYSTNPADGAVRIQEFKQLIKTFHDHGIRVILDVVYNHTGATEKSNFNQLVPGYYYRQDAMGAFSNASACGNETASERPMMRKFMRESVKHWVNEYHIDGFRFDLMGIHDMETMDLIAGDLRAIDPSIFIYGEGWTAGNSPLPDDKKALKRNTYLMDHVAAFSDDIRDGLKGHVFTFDEKGFVSGKEELEETVKFGIVASTHHPQIDYKQVNYSDTAWAKSPLQTVTYVSCHDNHTLWDRLTLSCPEAKEEEKKSMHKLALTIVLTSQGIPFLHAGVELGRTKYGEENSFESPDSINQLDWTWKTKNKDIFEYTRALIALRKAHPAFRMTTTEMLKKHIQFIDNQEDKLVVYTISDNANGDDWKNILLIFNGNTSAKKVSIPEGDWTLALNAGAISPEGIRKVNGTSVEVEASSALILFQKN